MLPHGKEQELWRAAHTTQLEGPYLEASGEGASEWEHGDSGPPCFLRADWENQRFQSQPSPPPDHVP